MALLIACTSLTPSSIVSKVLEWKHLKFLGLISYSLYVWQQGVLFIPWPRIGAVFLPLVAILSYETNRAAVYIAFGRRVVKAAATEPPFEGARVAAAQVALFISLWHAGFCAITVIGKGRRCFISRPAACRKPLCKHLFLAARVPWGSRTQQEIHHENAAGRANWFSVVRQGMDRRRCIWSFRARRGIRGLVGRVSSGHAS